MSVDLKAVIQKLNNTCHISLEASAAFCLTKTHYNIEVEHWLLKLMENKQSDIAILLSALSVDFGILQKDLNQNLALLKSGNSYSPAISQRLIDIMREALLIAVLEFGENIIRSAYIFLALFHDEEWTRFVKMLSPQFSKVTDEKIRDKLPEMLNQSEESAASNSHSEITSESTSGSLKQFTINLTDLARQGKLEEAVGRETEIRQMIDILLRRRQNNPILTGEPGVGKTAVVEGLAFRIIRGDVPPALENVAIHSLDLGLLQAGAGIRGEFENRLKSVIQEVKNSDHPIILFIDEAHSLIGAGGQSGSGDAANLLKPALARGELRTIAATTWAEYKKYFEKDAALTRRFHVVKINEPSIETAILMLRNTVNHLEKHHGLMILDEAVSASVHLSHRYLSERLLPDKAISVLDTACARAAVRATTNPMGIQQNQENIYHIDTEIRLLEREYLENINSKERIKILLENKTGQLKKIEKLEKQWQKEKQCIDKIRKLKNSDHKNNKEILKYAQKLKTIQGDKALLHECVNAELIAEVIADWTGIPVGRMLSDELDNLLNMESRMSSRIKGQNHALNMISRRLQTSRANLADPHRPMGVFLFAGPSGVGKTETALALTEMFYGSAQSLTVINLSEFKEEHKVSLLMGSPPGYVGFGEGGILTEAVRRRPYSLILLDEVEKAHSGIQDIFYQIFDKGILRDSEGRDIDFKNTVLILTSNIGSSLISQLCADPETMPTSEGLLEAIRPELLKFFKPAFLGRVTIVPYFALDHKILSQIADLQLDRIKQRVYAHYGAKIQFDRQIQKHLISQCHHSDTGARQIDHWLNHALLPKLSSYVLNEFINKRSIKNIKIGLDSTSQVIVEK